MTRPSTNRTSTNIRSLARHLAFAAALSGTLLAQPAQAGPFGEDLSRCLVASTSAAEKNELAQWMFMILASHPNMAKYANITADDRVRFNRRFAAIAERLATQSCKSQTVLALRNEGSPAVISSLKVLVEVASRELLGNPQVTQAAMSYLEYLDITKFIELGLNAR
jgi:hypothetical protein